MPVTAVQWLSFAALTLCNTLLLVSRDMASLDKRWLGQGAYLSPILLFVTLVMPWFIKCFANRTRDLPHGRRIGAYGRALLLLLFAVSAAIRLAGIEIWHESMAVRLLYPVGLALALTLCYGLFFTVLPANKLGMLFGAHSFLSFTLALMVQFATHIAELTLAQKQIVTFYTMQLMYIVMVLVAVTALYLLPTENGEEHIPRPARFRSKRTAFMLLLALVLFTILNGIMDGTIFWTFLPHNTSMQIVLPALVALTYPLAGALLDRNPQGGYRVVVALCTLCCMLAPVSTMLHSSPQFHYATRVALIGVSHIVYLCITVVLARLARGTYWLCLLAVLPLVIRILTLLVSAVLRQSAPPEPGILVFATILIAVVFYFMMNRYEPRLDTESAEAGGSTEAVAPVPDSLDAGAEPGLPDIPAEEAPEEAPVESSPLSSDTVFAQYGFSEREAEIAQYILRGDSTPDIAATLHISENTVNTHVKRLLRKTGLPHRRNLMALFMVDGKSNPKNGDQE